MSQYPDNTPSPSPSGTPALFLPIKALMLDILPTLSLLAFPLLFPYLALFPIAGLILGIVSLLQGKKRIGKTGIVLSIIAIALPALLIALIIVLLTGATMGLIALM